MLIAYILGFIVACLGYLYIGLNLSNQLPVDSLQYILFWAAYVIFGISIATVIFLGKIWHILQNKRGPVGPRGYRGDIGLEGQPGECFMEQYIVAIKRETLSAIANVLIAANLIKEHSEVYDTARLRLVNRYLDMRFQRQVDSIQMHNLMESGVKTTAEVASYISGLWAEWTRGIIDSTKNKIVVRKLFTQPTTTPTIDSSLDTYIQSEASRTDVWNWGHPPVIKRSIIQIRPYNSNYSTNGELRPYPYSPLKFHVVEYSDRDLSQLQSNPMWTSTGYPDAEYLDNKLLSNIYKNIPNTRGIKGTIRRPAIYMPKTWVDPKTKERYYPLGPVMIETEPQLMTNVKRYTLLVTGDIIIPNIVKGPIWQDTTKRTNTGVFYYLDTDQPGYAMLSTLWPVMGTDKYSIKSIWVGLGNMNNKTGILQTPSLWRGPVALPTSYLDKVVSTTTAPAINDIWIYRPPPLPRKGIERTKYLLKYGAPSKQHVVLSSINPATNDSTNYNIISIADSNTMTQLVNIQKWKIQEWVLKMGLPGNHNILPDAPLVTNQQTDNLGLAWYGEPQRDSKYSIFAFLGIIPEGQLRHKSSGRVFRFRHYGGPEPEIYNMIVTAPTLRYIRHLDTKPYLVSVINTSSNKMNIGNSVTFIPVTQQTNEDPEVVQWRISIVDPKTKTISRLNLSSQEKTYKQNIVLESVAKPGHILAIKTRADIRHNRWINNNSSNMDLANRRPADISLDSIYFEWHLLSNVTLASDMSTFILEPAA